MILVRRIAHAWARPQKLRDRSLPHAKSPPCFLFFFFQIPCQHRSACVHNPEEAGEYVPGARCYRQPTVPVLAVEADRRPAVTAPHTQNNVGRRACCCSKIYSGIIFRLVSPLLNALLYCTPSVPIPVLRPATAHAAPPVLSSPLPHLPPYLSPLRCALTQVACKSAGRPAAQAARTASRLRAPSLSCCVHHPLPFNLAGVSMWMERGRRHISSVCSDRVANRPRTQQLCNRRPANPLERLHRRHAHQHLAVQ